MMNQNPLPSILAGLGGMFAWGTSDFLANFSADRIGNLRTFFWSQAVGAVFVLLAVPFFGINTEISFFLAGFTLVTAVCYALGYLFFYKAFEIGNVSIVSATVSLEVTVTIILAMIFLGKSLTGLQFVSVVLILFGIILVSVRLDQLQKGTVSLFSGVKESLWSALFFGVFWDLSQYLSVNIGWMATTLYVKAGALIFLVIFSLFSKKSLAKFREFDRKLILTVALVGILEALAVISVNLGLAYGELVLVSPIASTFSVVTISLAVIFLKEKLSRTQVVGIAVAVFGIILTSL